MVIDLVVEFENSPGARSGTNTHQTFVGDLLDIGQLSLSLPGEVEIVSLPCGEWQVDTKVLVNMESSVADLLVSSAIWNLELGKNFNF